MNVYISVDIEGISSIVRPEQVNAINNPIFQNAYERSRMLMTNEIHAAIEGALLGGATRVIVNDSHSQMVNFLPEYLPEETEYIQGSPKPFGMMQGIGREMGCAFFIGYHARAGTLGGVLAHSSNDRVFSITLNGVEVGEFGINLALASHFGVPVVLVTGDSALLAEARALQNIIETVETKIGISRTAAWCKHPEIVCKLIKTASERAVQNSRKSISNIRVVLQPIEIQIQFQNTGHADMAELIPYSSRVNGRTVSWTGEEMESVYRTYRAMLALSNNL